MRFFPSGHLRQVPPPHAPKNPGHVKQAGSLMLSSGGSWLSLFKDFCQFLTGYDMTAWGLDLSDNRGELCRVSGVHLFEGIISIAN